jgi:hypothetical protein
MSAVTLEAAVDPDFKRLSNRYREYAIAGALHMDHLADMASADARSSLKRHAALLGPALDITAAEAEARLAELMEKHASEWAAYLRSAGKKSFLKQWARS